jgi:hypothetical protein
MEEMKLGDNTGDGGLLWEDADNRSFSQTIFFNRDGDHDPDADVTIRVQASEPAPIEFSTPVGRMKLARWEGIGRFEGELYELAVMCWQSGGFKLLRKISAAEARDAIAEKSPMLAALFG